MAVGDGENFHSSAARSGDSSRRVFDGDTSRGIFRVEFFQDETIAFGIGFAGFYFVGSDDGLKIFRDAKALDDGFNVRSDRAAAQGGFQFSIGGADQFDDAWKWPGFRGEVREDGGFFAGDLVQQFRGQFAFGALEIFSDRIAVIETHVEIPVVVPRKSEAHRLEHGLIGFEMHRLGVNDDAVKIEHDGFKGNG